MQKRLRYQALKITIKFCVRVAENEVCKCTEYPYGHIIMLELICAICMVGSYASLSVCLSICSAEDSFVGYNGRNLATGGVRTHLTENL